jgi:putative aldouronate transport system substrate-binding protein
MPVFQELEKRTNIHLEWQLLPAEDNLTKLNLIMASGDLPDLVSYDGWGDSKKTFDKFAAQGAIVALNDLIDQNAPNIKATLNNPPYKVPNLKAEITSADGKIYTLPTLTEVHTGMIFCIRQDWLDKLGLKVPETTDDLYAALKAFKEKDPNGNGQSDEIPFAPSDALPSVTTLMNAFGAHESYYADATDNKIKFGPIEDKYKEGLAYANKLYKEGLIDKTYINKNTDEFRAKISKNLVGMFYAWPMSGLGFANTAIQKVDPNAKYVAMLPVKGPNGDRFKERPQSMVGPRIVITSANKHQAETIKYLDYVYSKEGNILMNYGIEGKDYTLDASGNPIFTDYVLKNPDGKDPATVRGSEGMQIGLPYIATYASESQSVTDQNVKDAWKLYTESDVLYPNFPNVPLDETQIGDISGKLTDVKTLVDEYSDKFIMGVESLDNFGKFVETVKGMGIDEVLNTYNSAYAKYVEFNK